MLKKIDTHLRVFLFLLMGAGLVLASVFLMVGKIDGANWTAVCGILFGTNALSDSISRFGRGQS